MAFYNKLLYPLIILSTISFICTIVFNALSATSLKGLFLTTGKNISDKYSLEITPAPWTFSIWSVIYIWNGLWIIYVLSTICRRNAFDQIYSKSKIHPPEFFVLWILNNLINIGWLFLWDREYIIPSMIFLTLISFTCIMMLVISHRNCTKHAALLSKTHSADLWCIRILVHNGLATYATWTSIATLLNFGLVLKYEEVLPDTKASTIVLCMIFFAILFWTLLESFVYEKYVRYTFTIYPVAIVAAVGIFSGRNKSAMLSSNDVLNVTLIIVCAVACLVRIFLVFFCDKLRVLYSEKESNPTDEIAASHKDEKVGLADAEVQSPNSFIPTTESNGVVNPVAIEMTESR